MKPRQSTENSEKLRKTYNNLGKPRQSQKQTKENHETIRRTKKHKKILGGRRTAKINQGQPRIKYRKIKKQQQNKQKDTNET